MHSLSKTLFHVIAIFCLLMTAALWFASVGQFTALNELVDKLSNLHFSGYGLEIVDPQKRRVAVALLGSCVGVYLSVSFFTIGWMNGSLKALKAFSSLTGSLLGLIFCGLWIKFLGDDHIVSSSEKMELLGISISLVSGTIFLCWAGFRKSIARRPAKDAANLATLGSKKSAEAPAKSDDKSDLPSVEALLDEEGASAVEGEEGVETPTLDSVADELEHESVKDDQVDVEAAPDVLPEDDEAIPPPVEDVAEDTALQATPPEEPDIPDELEIPDLPPAEEEPLSPSPALQESTVNEEPDRIAEDVPPLPTEETQEPAAPDVISTFEGDTPNQGKEAALTDPPPSDPLNPEGPPPLPDGEAKGSQEAA